MAARLLWRDASGREGTVDLTGFEIYIGRSQECMIRSDDPMMSRKHARIYVQNGQHVIEDLNSANGMFFNDQKIPTHAFKHGDAVRCGSLWLRYVGDGYATPSAQMPAVVPPPQYGAPPAAQQQYGGGPPPAAPSYGQPPPAAPPPSHYGQAAAYGGGPPPGPTGHAMAAAVAPAPAPEPPPPAPPPPPVAAAPPAAAAPPQTSANMAAAAAPSSGPPPDVALARLQRRVEQLQMEVRLARGGGPKADRMQELDSKIAELENEKEDLHGKIKDLEANLVAAGSTAQAQKASSLQRQADEVVSGLNDVISEIRPNLMAAQGEVEQWAYQLPKSSFELVREAVRSTLAQLETAKGLIRQLRDR